MPEIQLVDTTGTPVSEEALDAFKKDFAGTTFTPEDSGYDGARTIWNASVEKRPGLIARCAGVADVVASVNFARETNILTAIRGGGHNVAGRALCDSGIVIDLSALTGVFVDVRNRTVRAQGGVTLGQLDRETHLHGLAVPVGVVSGTGIAGLTLGGGVGWLARKYGMTIDNLLSCEVVTVDGKVITASAGSNEDLFWALRGGGGNFGVVTSFKYQAHPVHTALCGFLVHPRSEAGALLRHFRDFAKSAPEELTTYAGLLTLPDGTDVAALIPCYCGDLSEGEKVVQPLRDFGSPIADTIQPTPFPAVQSMLDASYPTGNHHYWKSAMLKEFPDEAIDIFVAHANQAASPLTSIVLELSGGAAARVDPAATAFAHRDMTWDVGIFPQWTDPDQRDTHITWARNLAAALEPFASDAHIISFLDDEPDAVVRASFGPNYERLRQIKKKYDPDNFFRVNQNIEPGD